MLFRFYYGASAANLVRASPATVLGELVTHHTFAVDQGQRNAWQAEIKHLQEVANALPDSFFSWSSRFLAWESGQTQSSSQAVLFS